MGKAHTSAGRAMSCKKLQSLLDKDSPLFLPSLLGEGKRSLDTITIVNYWNYLNILKLGRKRNAFTDGSWTSA